MRDVEQLSQQSGSGDFGVDQAGGGLQILDQSRPPIWAVINAQPNPALNAYGFARVDDGKGDGTFPSLTGTTETGTGSTTDGSLVAWEANGRTDVAIDGSVKVLLVPNRFGRGYTFAVPSGSSPPPPPSAPLGYGWLAGLTADDCLYLTVTAASGRCVDIDDAQELLLLWDTASWVSDGDFTHDGGAGPAEFVIDGSGVPKLTIDSVVGVIDGSGETEDGDPYIDFAFGGTTLCTADPGACGSNVFKVRLVCSSCAIRPGYAYTTMTSATGRTLCRRWYAEDPSIGGSGRYTGLRGDPLQVTTTADLAKCDVYVYHFFYYYDNPDPDAPTFADVGAWVAAGGRAILLTAAQNPNFDPGNTWRSRVNVALAAMGSTIRMGSGTSINPEGSAGTCGYAVNVASRPVTSGLSTQTYGNLASVPISPGSGTQIFGSTSSNTPLCVIEPIGDGYVMVMAPALTIKYFPPNPCLNDVDFGEAFRDLESLLV